MLLFCIRRSRMGQILEVNAERRDRLQAHGDYTVAPDQQLSDIWHKALRNPAETQGPDTSAQGIKCVLPINLHLLCAYAMISWVLRYS